MSSLADKVVIVTGAAQGMGFGHVQRCLAEGARVVATDIGDEFPDELADHIGVDLEFVQQDVVQPDDWARVVNAAVARWGRLDGLVNNAAIYPEPTPLDELDTETFERVLHVNLMGVWHGTKAVIEPFRAAGGGSIVNVSSTAGQFGIPRLTAYGTSKWAVRGFTKYAAQDLGRFGIRVNSIHPGGILDTGMFPSCVGGRDRAGARRAVGPLRTYRRGFRAGHVPALGAVVVHLRSRAHRRRRLDSLVTMYAGGVGGRRSAATWLCVRTLMAKGG